MPRSYLNYRPGLVTDMYHPDSAYVSWRVGLNGLTTFDLYARRAPFGGSYLLVAGLEAALEFVRDFRYSDEDLAFLGQIRDYEPEFLDDLRSMRFSGEILAMPEGAIAFPNEPLLRVTAPFREAILLESGLLQAINLATLIATKASRIVWAAQGRPVSEFSLRRAQEPFVVTRSSRIGGCTSTSFLAAAFQYRLLATGTVPHALIQLFDDERAAFEAVAETYNRYTLLLDTYDVRRAVHTAIEVAKKYRESLGHILAGVRLDSGDLLADSRYVRDVLDEAGLRDVRVLASGDLDEFRITELLEQRAPIDAFGVGTSLGVGAGSVEREVEGGALGGVFKQVLYVDELGAQTPKMKVAGEKSTLPGKKEVYRIGAFEEDVIQLAGEPRPGRDAERLLRPVVRGGQVVPGSLPPLSELWEFASRNLKLLPERYRRLDNPDAYPVRYSKALCELRDSAMAGHNPADPSAPIEPDSDDRAAHALEVDEVVELASAPAED
ncbi:MAG: nicotinate phosphoribosyltransferase [Chloroflexi bacterium]|nr:nicotinate phosphoribosyltransferase [Chloroflexota bacterium]